MKRRTLATTTLVVGLLAALAPQADAAFIMQLTSGGAPVAITDNGVGDDNPTVGLITYSGDVGGWNLLVETALSKDASGTAQMPFMKFVSVSGAIGTLPSIPLTIEITDTDYQFNPQLVGFQANITTAPSSPKVAYTTYFDDANVPFGTATLVADLATGPGLGLTDSGGTFATPSGPYSLTMKLVLDPVTSASGPIIFDAELLGVVPEPTALGVWTLLGTLGMCGMRRRA